MKIFSSVVAVSGLVLAVGAVLAPVTADAARSQRQFNSHAAGLCQGAMPAFETAIRKRPLSVQNEGTSNAFVTCSFTSQGTFIGADNPTIVQVFFNSVSGTDIEINCTGVSGRTGDGTNQYLPKTVVVLASGNPQHISWVASDFSGAPAYFPPGGLFSISCNLPPGAAINDTHVYFEEEIGT